MRRNEKIEATGSNTLKSIMPRAFLFVIMYVFTPVVSASKKIHSRCMPKVVIVLTLIFFKFSLYKYRKLGYRSFQCLVYTIVGQYFTLTRNYTFLRDFLKSILSPFIHSHPGASTCFVRLQSFAFKNVMAVFLHELKYVDKVREAEKLASWFYEKIVTKKPQQKVDLVVDGRFAIVLMSAQHYQNIPYMYLTLNYLRRAINHQNVKRIYVLATGNAMIVAKWFESFLLTELGLTKSFEKKSAVIGDTHPSTGLALAYKVK